MNVVKPKSMLRDSEKDYALYTVVHDADNLITCIYLDSNGEKRKMYLHELALFSDGTLMLVKKELKKRL